MADQPKTCLVVQGYGEKTDLTDGRRLNLNASYAVIKDAVEQAGLRCIRSDEIVKGSTIDVPIYEWILNADLLIADLSTYNVNAAYQLGVRYGVAPSATIVVAEEKFNNPFDFTHFVLHRYKHLGEDIGLAEARRFIAYLSGVIREVMAGGKTDSPVYELLDLVPPVRRDRAAAEAAAARPAAEPARPPIAGDSAKGVLDRARAAMRENRYQLARELLQTVHAELLPNDPYVLQQLALATYKSRDPDPITALRDARDILHSKLNADTTNDPETLGLWGAVHKRLWDLEGDRKNLDTAIAAYERGFYLKQDYYSGSNVAFLFNVSAAEYQHVGRVDEAVEDFALARRIRRAVVRICEQALEAPSRTLEDEYWIFATLWEASVGLGDAAAAEKWHQAMERSAPAAWMLESTNNQVASLQGLIDNSPLKNLTAAR